MTTNMRRGLMSNPIMAMATMVTSSFHKMFGDGKDEVNHFSDLEFRLNNVARKARYVGNHRSIKTTMPFPVMVAREVRVDEANLRRQFKDILENGVIVKYVLVNGEYVKHQNQEAMRETNVQPRTKIRGYRG